MMTRDPLQEFSSPVGQRTMLETIHAEKHSSMSLEQSSKYTVRRAFILYELQVRLALGLNTV